MIAVNLGDKPLADFTQPIEMRKDCHRRIEHFLDVLRKVERRLGKGELNEAGRRALEASLNYFTNFAPRHTADEEQFLFPHVRRSTGSTAHAIMADMGCLEQDHRRAEACPALVDKLVRHWLRTGRLNEVQRKHLRATLDELAATYAAHTHLEEQRVFVFASQLLEAEQLREIGAEMKRRRAFGGSLPAAAVAGILPGLSTPARKD